MAEDFAAIAARLARLGRSAPRRLLRSRIAWPLAVAVVAVISAAGLPLAVARLRALRREHWEH